MESSGVGSSQMPGAKSQFASIPVSRSRGSSGVSIVGAPAKPSALQSAMKVRRLLAHQGYFGLEPRAFHVGTKRTLERISAPAPEQARIDAHSLAEDFRLDAAPSGTLLRAFLAGGLLHPDGTGGYCVTERFREYALACVVVPLSRARAKALIDKACGIAASINADWARNPFMIKMVAVSGSYMSRRNSLPELSLWLVLRRRPQPRVRRWRPPLKKGDALRQILAAMNSLSSFIVVRIVPDRQGVHRPFSVVFQANDDAIESSLPAWERFRDWGASISRRLASG